MRRRLWISISSWYYRPGGLRWTNYRRGGNTKSVEIFIRECTQASDFTAPEHPQITTHQLTPSINFFHPIPHTITLTSFLALSFEFILVDHDHEEESSIGFRSASVGLLLAEPQQQQQQQQQKKIHIHIMLNPHSFTP